MRQTITFLLQILPISTLSPHELNMTSHYQSIIERVTYFSLPYLQYNIFSTAQSA